MSHQLYDYADEQVTTTLQLDYLQATAAEHRWLDEAQQKTVVLAARTGASLKVLPLPQAGRTVIGRADTHGIYVPDVDLSDYDALELGVSRHHAMLEQVYGVFTLTDMGSTNGTHVNGRRLMTGENRILSHGAVVCLGKLVLYVYMV